MAIILRRLTEPLDKSSHRRVFELPIMADAQRPAQPRLRIFYGFNAPAPREWHASMNRGLVAEGCSRAERSSLSIHDRCGA
jgi:hypothetical protein